MKYDYLIVGAGLYGAMSAYTLNKKGYKCLVIDKRNHIGGFCYTEKKYGIDVHMYGAHIFRTNRKEVWDFVNTICEFVPFVNSPIAKNNGKVYNLPFNMNTFCQLYECSTPQEAKDATAKDIVKCEHPTNLEDHVLSIAGKKIYETLVKEYTEKQWGKNCKELPAEIMKRIPLRFTFDNNYYNELYQGIPKYGYTKFIEKLLDGSDVRLGIDYFSDRSISECADKMIFTGEIDKFFDYRYGKLEYRSVDFVHHEYNEKNVQGVAVVNYTTKDVPYTRSIEHRHFIRDDNENNKSIVSYEYPSNNGEPSYPVNTRENMDKLALYKKLAKETKNVDFLGRLAEYKYLSMNDIIEQFI